MWKIPDATPDADVYPRRVPGSAELSLCCTAGFNLQNQRLETQ